MDMLNRQKFIFGSIFLLANRLQAIGDQYLGKDNITTKQWFLTIMISQFQNNPPTLTEVADLMGSSRQNVKQLALKLEEKGFLIMEKDRNDARALRLKLTEQCKTYWEQRSKQDNKFIIELFSQLSESEIDAVNTGFKKLFNKIEELEKSI
jgi:Transcriptional regulators